MKTILSLTFSLLACLMSYGQVQQLNIKEDVEDVNIIGYFCKNDTMTYNYRSLKMDIQGNDTVVKYDLEEEYMLTVIDSTADGYTMLLKTLSCDVRTVQPPLTVKIANKLKDMTMDIPVIFKTDEFGSVQTIVNWREIRDVTKKGIKMMFDEAYKNDASLDTILPRRQFESALVTQFSTENNIRESYDELELLFGLHGKAIKNGISEEDGVENGFPQHFTINAFYTPEEDDGDMEGDYAVLGKTVTKIPAKDAIELGISALGTIVGDKVQDKMEEINDTVLKDFADGDIEIINEEQYYNSFNGWPKECMKSKIVNWRDYKKIETNIIVWTSRSWENY